MDPLVLVFDGWGIPGILAVLLVSAVVVLFAGVRLTKGADTLADRTGLGEAVFGGVLLGASTSLSGIVTSVLTAYRGFPELSASNAVGGIAVQTAFLAVADIVYRRANLEHAAASMENLLQGALLSVLLALPLAIATAPALSVFGVHPATFLLFGMYAIGIVITKGAQERRLWRPLVTGETVMDRPDDSGSTTTGRLWVRFVIYALMAAIGGYFVGVSGIGLVVLAGLDETVVGALVTAVATSLPELVVVITAVRRGALTLAVGGIIGGNVFDVLFLGASDLAYREGSLYHALSSGGLFLISLTIMMTGILLLGLLRRQRHGPFGIGFESLVVLFLYATGVVVISVT